MEKALEAFHQGLQRDPQNTLLLKNLAVHHANRDELDKTYLFLGRALKIDPGLADAKKIMDDVTGRIRKATTGPCPSCEGAGKFETIIEEERKRRRKVINACGTCKGTGKSWKRPCAECFGTGRIDYYEYCKACFGRGHILEPEGR